MFDQSVICLIVSIC